MKKAPDSNGVESSKQRLVMAMLANNLFNTFLHNYVETACKVTKNAMHKNGLESGKNKEREAIGRNKGRRENGKEVGERKSDKIKKTG